MHSQHALRRTAIASIAALSLAVSSAALADQTSNSQSPLYHNAPSRCSGITGLGTGASGNVLAHRNPDGTVTVNLVIRNALPDTTYYPNILCVRFFGTITTNSQGTAEGHFVLSGVPPVFSISVETGGGVDTFTSDVMTAT